MSDQSLRAALEKLCREWASEGHDGADLLNQILTAHPAESVPVADRKRIAYTLARLTGVNEKEGLRLADALFSAGVFRSEAVALDRDAVEQVVTVCGFGYASTDDEISARHLGMIGNTVDRLVALARPEAVVKAEALREAAAYASRQTAEWLRERAAELEAGR